MPVKHYLSIIPCAIIAIGARLCIPKAGTWVPVAPTTQLCLPRGDVKHSRWVNFESSKSRPIRWIVEDVIPADTVTLISSTSGAGKSMIALHLSLCLMTDNNWLGHKCFKSNVGYWDQDNPDSVLTENRICAIVKGMGIDMSSLSDSWVFRPHASAILMQEDLRNKLIVDLVSRKIGVIIIDTFASVNPYEESAVMAARVITDGLFPFVEAGITPIILHHIGKDHVDFKGKVRKRTGIHAARGSSALIASVGAAFNLMMDGDDRYLECVKPRYGNVRPIKIEYDENGAIGLPEWEVRIGSPSESRLSYSDLTQIIARHKLSHLSSRKLVKRLSLMGFKTSQSTASKALSE